ncbi:response regulator transcription factor [Aliirhizobium terrae]|uniref:response regulator transcription factor n=1 Tax=Terrirhizobium terrae TaxID=2926709 RepID=UPI0025756364|nr:response regulator transcription factor [Rhizobium sp. CC-CFT758]WJH41498.1 response regulator transcription factor [Rhizobium sp. CC-CFT758]
MDKANTVDNSEKLSLDRRDGNELPLVRIVDDDVAIRESLVDLFRSVGIDAQGFSSANDLLQDDGLDRPGCIILDLRMPGMSGFDFQLRLEQAAIRRPIIFITGFGDVPTSVRAMKAGAVDFLTKPFRDQDVLDAATVALAKDRSLRQEQDATTAASDLFKTLTGREKEVMWLVVEGRMNKQIAFALGISDITVKLHRGNVMRKMQVHSVADLVRLSEMIRKS